jgi:hypothetical protein
LQRLRFRPACIQRPAQVAALEARLREAGEQKPIYQWRNRGAVVWLDTTSAGYEAAQKDHDETRIVYAAAPVPAQPAVPEAVAKDAIRAQRIADDVRYLRRASSRNASTHPLRNRHRGEVMFYFARFNVETMQHEVCVQKDRRSASARLVASFDTAADAEFRAAQLNETDTEGRKDE